MSDVSVPGVRIVAIACVLDSSLTLASEWHTILEGYIFPLFKRLSEMHQGYQFRIGFVIYATADARPTPILTRRFFSTSNLVVKELKEDPAKIGIGQTSGNETRGMAALEGLVAAVELFDALRLATYQGNQPQPSGQSLSKDTSSPIPLSCHIFHIAASPPDSAPRPLWNTSPLLDSVSWDTLPHELRKRDINLSIINLSQLPQFPELYMSAAAGSAQQPWFNVRSSHCLYLAGFTVQQKSSKRSGESPSTEKTPESKRLRTQQPLSDTSPGIPSATVPDSTQPRPSSVPTLLPPSINPSFQTQPQAPRPPLPPQQQVVDRLRIAERQLQFLEKALNEAMVNGKPEVAEKMREERNKRLIMYQQLNAMRSMYPPNQQAVKAEMQQDVGASTGASSMPNTLNSSTITQPESPMHPVQPSATNGNSRPLSLGQDESTPAPDQKPIGRPLSHHTPNASSPLSPNTSPNQAHQFQHPPRLPPQIVAQMQKITEEQRNRPTSINNPLPLGQTQNPSTHTGQVSGANPTSDGQTKLALGRTVWQGVLTWTGFDATTQSRKEVHAQVAAAVQNDRDSLAETWPNTLTLIPSREPAVSLRDLQAWIKQHKPVLCTIQPKAWSVDAKTNQSHYRLLVQLLTEKKIYALAAWTLPSGVLHNNVLVFPVNNIGLIGAFFPLFGIPDLPKPAMTHFAMRLQSLTPEQRKMVLTQMMERQRQQHQLRQQQLTQQQEPSNPTISTQLPLNLEGTQPQGMGLNAQQVASGQRPINGGLQGGVLGNMSYEVMQSFMQRSAEGGGPGVNPN